MWLERGILGANPDGTSNEPLVVGARFLATMARIRAALPNHRSNAESRAVRIRVRAAGCGGSPVASSEYAGRCSVIWVLASQAFHLSEGLNGLDEAGRVWELVAWADRENLDETVSWIKGTSA